MHEDRTIPAEVSLACKEEPRKHCQDQKKKSRMLCLVAHDSESVQTHASPGCDEHAQTTDIVKAATSSCQNEMRAEIDAAM